MGGPRCAGVAAVLGCAALLPAAPQTTHTAGEREPVRAERLADTDGDGRQELLLVLGSDGAATLVRVDLGVRLGETTGRILLPDPAHTLLAVADLLPAAGDEVVAADPRGTACLSWQPDGAPTVLARRARLELRVGSPQFAPFVADLNQDGRPDLLLPELGRVRPFLQEAPVTDGTPAFRAMAPVPVDLAVDVDPGSAGLDQELVGRLRVAPIRTEDLNGDGRPDLLTQTGQVHGFHLQTADGTFAPPIEVDLEQFVDSTPKATVAPGSTIVLGDRQLLQRGDVDGDGIPDYVIAHRRKLWTFLAGSDGPQFTRARTQAVADDVTAMLLVDLDDDRCFDLLTFRVQLPGVGALLLGLVQSIDIDVRAVGYRSAPDGFAATPAWRRTVTLRIPPLLSLLSRQEELVQRFRDIAGKVRLSARGRFRGTDATDLVVVQPDGRTALLFGDVGAAPELASRTGQRLLRRLLFEDEDTLFDLDRLFGVLSGLFDELAETPGDERALATLPLRDPAAWRLADLLVGDVDGAPGDELLLVYHAVGEDLRRAYDVVAWR